MGYRFFSALCGEYTRASILQQDSLVAAWTLQTLHPDHHSPGWLIQDSRRHAGNAALGSRGRLFLPLLGIAPARRLREAVRLEEICLALVGHQMRETSHADAEKRFTRRPEIPASRPL